MAIEPMQTPEQRKALAEARNSHTKWGDARGTMGTDPRGDSAYRLIGSHERAPPDPRKVAIREAGKRGLPAPGGPKGMNAPLPAKQPKGR
jgi:hypothetical protein